MNNQKEEVQQILDTLQPAMEADGGGVDLVSIQDGIVTIKFKGACLLCPSIGMTMNLAIKKTLMKNLPWINDIVKINSGF